MLKFSAVALNRCVRGNPAWLYQYRLSTVNRTQQKFKNGAGINHSAEKVTVKSLIRAGYRGHDGAAISAHKPNVCFMKHGRSVRLRQRVMNATFVRS